jgi:predicted small metal-binding protein
MSAPVKVSNLVAAELENLKRRSEESDRRIAEHLKKLHQRLDEMKAIELDTVTD